MSFSDQELEEFKAEALELLEIAEKSLLALDSGAEFRPSFDAIFRGFHNLKGAAGMMELMELQAHTHELENILMSFKDGDSIPKPYISLFLRGIDGAKSILDGQKISFNYKVEQAAQVGPTEVQVTKVSEVPALALDEFVCECEEIIERISVGLQQLENESYSSDTVDALYRDVHSLKGGAYLFSFSLVGDLAHAMESSLEKIRAGGHLPSTALINCLFKSIGVIESLIQRIKQKASDKDFTSIVSAIIRALNLSAEKLEARTTQKKEPEVETISVITPKEKESENEGTASIRVSVSLLDNLMALMGEMVLVRNQVLQYSNKSEDMEFLSMSKRLNAVTSEIQGEMMKTRMQPIGNVLNKFNRVVRDLSQELKKSISINFHGAETELDKSLLEAIKDPLTHIVRNSCDHGIEAPEVRREHGKSETGTINIKAYHEGGQVVIEVNDDGKGLHTDVLLRKAMEKGLISQDQANKLTDKEIYNLIFAPGFSTAAAVTNLSGRGVGMDVVRTNIERIGGTVEINGAAGIGTSIKIKIPLTLAIVPALIVKCGEGTFAIPQVKLEGLLRVDQSNVENKIETLHGALVYRLRGNILPLVDLNKVLGIETNNKTIDENSIVTIAVLNAEQCSFGVIIDEIHDTADIVVKPLNRLLKSLKVYSGATILGDGSVALIFDVIGISKVAQLGQEKAQSSELEIQNGKAHKTADLQDFLLVRLNSPAKHALALAYVNRLEEFNKKDIEYSGSQRVIRYRDIILPLVSASEHLGYEPRKVESETFPVVVIQRAGQLFGLEVEEILDTLSTTTEMDTSLVPHPGIFGNLNTSEELIVVINPFELINREFPEDKTTPIKTDGGLRILLVEDTVFFRKSMKHLFEERGYEVVTAEDGKEALDILNEHNQNFDLIVSDIEMPRMNGFQLAANVRKHPVFSKIPMLAISSRADKQYKTEGVKSGFDVYLEKLKPSVLLAAVVELTSKARNVA